MTTYPRIVALNDECDSCSRCGRTGLKRVAWIATEPGEDPIPYGTTCALRVLRAAGKVSREARGWRAVELAYGQQQRADVRRVVGEYVKGIRVDTVRNEWGYEEVRAVGPDGRVATFPTQLGAVRSIVQKHLLAKGISQKVAWEVVKDLHY